MCRCSCCRFEAAQKKAEKRTRRQLEKLKTKKELDELDKKYTYGTKWCLDDDCCEPYQSI